MTRIPEEVLPEAPAVLERCICEDSVARLKALEEIRDVIRTDYDEVLSDEDDHTNALRTIGRIRGILLDVLSEVPTTTGIA